MFLLYLLIAGATSLALADPHVSPPPTSTCKPFPSPKPGYYCGERGGFRGKTCIDRFPSSTRNYEACYHGCLNDKRCVSFAYKSSKNYCELFSKSLESQGFYPSSLKKKQVWDLKGCFDVDHVYSTAQLSTIVKPIITSSSVAKQHASTPCTKNSTSPTPGKSSTSCSSGFSTIIKHSSTTVAPVPTTSSHGALSTKKKCSSTESTPSAASLPVYTSTLPPYGYPSIASLPVYENTLTGYAGDPSNAAYLPDTTTVAQYSAYLSQPETPPAYTETPAPYVVYSSDASSLPIYTPSPVQYAEYSATEEHYAVYTSTLAPYGGYGSGNEQPTAYQSTLAPVTTSVTDDIYPTGYPTFTPTGVYSSSDVIVTLHSLTDYADPTVLPSTSDAVIPGYTSAITYSEPSFTSDNSLPAYTIQPSTDINPAYTSTITASEDPSSTSAAYTGSETTTDVSSSGTNDIYTTTDIITVTVTPVPTSTTASTTSAPIVCETSLVTSTSTAIPTNIIQNPGFETIDGANQASQWSLSGGADIQNEQPYAFDGTISIILYAGNDSPDGIVAQSLSSIDTSLPYTVSWYYRDYAIVPSPVAPSSDKTCKLVVTWGSVILDTKSFVEASQMGLYEQTTVSGVLQPDATAPLTFKWSCDTAWIGSGVGLLFLDTVSIEAEIPATTTTTVVTCPI